MVPFALPYEVLESPTLSLVTRTRTPDGPPARTRRFGRAARCRRCHESVPVEAATVISSHRTRTGSVTYVRCSCGGAGLVIEERTA